MDIAELGIKVTSSGVNEANTSLNLLTVNSGKAEKAVEGLAKSELVAADAARNNAATQSSAATSTANITKGSLDAQVALMGQGRAANTTSGALHNSALKMNGVGKSSQVAGHHLNNMVYQLNDVAVTAAMGMNPLMILMQQGSQIGQIFMTAGVGVRGWLAAVGLTNPVVLGVAAAIGVGALALNKYKKSLNEAAKNDEYVKSLGLTKKELKELGNTTITYGDMVRGLWKTIKDGLNLDKVFSSIASFASKAFDLLLKAGRMAWVGILGHFMGYNNAIKFALPKLSDAIGDAFISGTNFAINAINDLLKKSYAGINSFVTLTNSLLEKVNAPKLDLLGDAPVLANLANPYEGSLKNLGNGVLAAYKSGYSQADTTLSNLGNKIKNDIIEASQARLKDKADKIKDDRSEKKKAAEDKVKKPEVDPWIKFYEDSKNSVVGYTASVNSMIRTQDLSVEAATKQAFYTELENRAREQGIKTLSTLQKTQLEALASQHAHTKMVELTSKFFDDANNSAIAYNSSVEQQVKMLGMGSIAAETYAYKQNLVSKALKELGKDGLDASGKATIAKLVDEYQAAATKLSDAQFNEENKQSLNDYIKQVEESSNLLFINAEAADVYRYRQSLLNKAIKDYGEQAKISAARMADIDNMTGEYAKSRNLQSIIDKTNEWRTTLKSTFAEMVKGSMSFKDALGQILNKLIEMSANDLFDNLWGMVKGGKGSSGDGKFGGGVWSTVANVASSIFKKNALGDVYSNSPSLSSYSGKVVNQPTPFMFANGAGLMGEAGPEAIMPLKRGSDGKLGVAGTGGAQIIALPISIGGEKIDERIIAISGGVAQEVTGRAISGLGKSQSRNAAYRVR